MADSNPNELVFRGSTPEECETFVSTIRKRALAEKMHLDDQWIAFMASSCFVGDALYWYEDLDREVQEDWNRLRPALLARFGRRTARHTPTPGASLSSVSAPPSSVPTPAAAPPAQVTSPQVRKGHLKVLDLHGRFCGYLGGRENDGRYNTLVATHGQALLVSLPSLSMKGTFEIELVANSQVLPPNDFLAVVWTNLPGLQWMNDQGYCASCCSWSSIKSGAATRDYAMERNVWRFSEDLELCVQYPKPDGGVEPLRPYVLDSSNSLVWQKQSAASKRGPAGVRLIFEETN